MFYLLLPTPAARQALITHLARVQDRAVFHYLPLHLSKFGLRYGGKPGDLPVTEDISDRLLRLPLLLVKPRESNARYRGSVPVQTHESLDRMFAEIASFISAIELAYKPCKSSAHWVYLQLA